MKENLVAAHSEEALETLFIGDEWIRQSPQPLLTHKQSRKTDWLPSQKWPPKLLSQVTNAFVTPHNPF